MAIIDAQLLFSDAQALTGTSLVPSTNVIDLGVDRNIGLGEPLEVTIIFKVSLAGTTPTITIALQASSTVGFGSPVTVATTATLAQAAGAAGQIVSIRVPNDASTDRYLRLAYTMGGTSPTATVSAWLGPASMAMSPITHYNDNVTIS